MAATLRVKPADPDALVRVPERNFLPLPAEGADVPDNAYWRRRLRDGDVTIIADEPAPATPAAKKKEG